MADRFYDTSAFAKHYRAELGSAKVDAFLAETGSHHFLSALGVVEFHSVLARLVRMGQITAADFHLARAVSSRHNLWPLASHTGDCFSFPSRSAIAGTARPRT
jgi:hypothetical protein